MAEPDGDTTMKGYVANIEDLTVDNGDFRHVLYTAHHLQLVLMSLERGEEIGAETHKSRDQFFRIEKGKGKIVIDGTAHKVRAGDAMIVPAGAAHNLINTGRKRLKVYTIYGPPNHRDGLVQRKKAEAEASEEHFDGKTTE